MITAARSDKTTPAMMTTTEADSVGMAETAVVIADTTQQTAMVADNRAVNDNNLCDRQPQSKSSRVTSWSTWTGGVLTPRQQRAMMKRLLVQNTSTSAGSDPGTSTTTSA
ncbi:hypothetical protein PR003_g11976 [Phytophthora rubi]|uniref:Uncharacterized protein n=1 Tax=Phytophthora rubi TaxID=129364 RepID=A0A6A4FJS2_9STRA|nr:hypothetical protein PR001_g9538 [Phytophthora rubi]KAE9337500.1 hypothetical protein PR003_g11976 [Phytophthora rubi]